MIKRLIARLLGKTYRIVSEDEVAAALAEWERRYREDPDLFVSENERLATSTLSYGEAGARYLFFILNEQAEV